MNTPSTSLERALMETLRKAEEPLTVAQMVERLPAALGAGGTDARRKLKTLLNRPDVGHAGRGQFVYLPSRITGSTLRLPLTGREVENGWLQLGPEIVYALWFRRMEYDHPSRESEASFELPDGTPSRIIVERLAPNVRASFHLFPLVAAGRELRDWLQAERVAAGDSLRVQIVDAEYSRCRIEIERLSERGAERMTSLNQALADAAAQVLRDDVRGSPLSAGQLAGWLLAKKQYWNDCPPDPLLVVLAGDQRFTRDDRGRFSLASKWEWVRDLEEQEIQAAIVEMFAARDEEAEALRAAEPGRNWPPRIDPIRELQPWLEAVGVETGSARATTSPVAEADRASLGRQVFRLLATLKHRPSMQRVIEARGDNTLSELDHALRRAFRHDTMDHMSGFFVPAGGRRGRQTLATINPFYEIEEGKDWELGALGLELGDELSYVYDFGDWIEHTIQVEAVLAPEPRADYPRSVNLARGSSAGGAGARTPRRAR